MLNTISDSDVWKQAKAFILNPPEGVPSTWPIFNDLLGGFRPHELTLFCAPTGSGKTQWLASLSQQLCKLGVWHMVAPVETGFIDFKIRVFSALARKDFNTGDRFTLEEIEKLESDLGPLVSQAPIVFSTHENRVDVKSLIGDIVGAYTTFGCRIILLDNLNFFLEVTSASEQVLAMDHAIHELVMLCKQLPVHIILVVHPRKTDGGRVESEFDIKGSSTAVQETHNIMLYNRPKPEDIENRTRDYSDRELVFKKIRRRGFNVNKPVWFKYVNGLIGELANQPRK